MNVPSHAYAEQCLSRKCQLVQPNHQIKIQAVHLLHFSFFRASCRGRKKKKKERIHNPQCTWDGCVIRIIIIPFRSRQFRLETIPRADVIVILIITVAHGRSFNPLVRWNSNNSDWPALPTSKKIASSR